MLTLKIKKSVRSFSKTTEFFDKSLKYWADNTYERLIVLFSTALCGTILCVCVISYYKYVKDYGEKKPFC